MSIEPTEQEYEALGREVMQRARARTRRRRGAQFLAVGAAAAMVSAVATTALLGSPSDGQRQSAAEQQGGAERSIGYTVTCFSDQDEGETAADAVTIRRASGGDEPAARFAVAECGRVWQAGVLGARVTGQSAGPSVELQGPQDSSAESAESAPPRLQACEQPDGSFAVLPDPDARAARLCGAPSEEELP